MGAPSITISFIEKSNDSSNKRRARDRDVMGKRHISGTGGKSGYGCNRERHTGQLKRCNGRTDQTCNDWLHKCPEEGNCVLHGNCRRRRKKAAIDAGYKKAMEASETIKFNYLAIPTVETDQKAQEVATWVKTMRDVKKKEDQSGITKYGGR